MVSRTVVIGAVSLALLLGISEPSQAQRQGGSQRSGTYQRTGPRGGSQSGTTQGYRTWERGTGYRKSTGESKLSTQRGEVSNQRASETTRTGKNSYDRSWDSTTTGPAGRSRSWEGQGSGTVKRTDSGFSKDYNGSVTSPKGEVYTVDKSTDKTKTESGWESTTSKSVTDSQGNPVLSGERESEAKRGEGVESNTTWTNPETGVSGGATARFRYENGQWVREKESSLGGSSTTTGGKMP